LLAEDPLFIAVASAVVGTLVGAIATLSVQKHQDGRKEKQQDERTLREKVHLLETRIIRLETEMDLLNRQGQRGIDGLIHALEGRHV
jgi:hypothetical protein